MSSGRDYVIIGRNDIDDPDLNTTLVISSVTTTPFPEMGEPPAGHWLLVVVGLVLLAGLGVLLKAKE